MDDLLKISVFFFLFLRISVRKLQIYWQSVLLQKWNRMIRKEPWDKGGSLWTSQESAFLSGALSLLGKSFPVRLALLGQPCQVQGAGSSDLVQQKGREVKVKVIQSCLTLQPHGLCSPWNSLGQKTGVGSLSLLQGIFPIQGSNWSLLHCRQILHQLSHKGNPSILEWTAYPFSSGSS